MWDQFARDAAHRAVALLISKQRISTVEHVALPLFGPSTTDDSDRL